MKKIILLSLLMCVHVFVNAQQSIAKTNHPERTNILNALRKPIEKELHLEVKFVVEELNIEHNMAFFRGQVKNKLGKDIDFTKTVYNKNIEEGFFDGDGTTALLKKVKGVWKVITYVIGPTDVAWADWPDKYKVSKKLCGLQE